LGRARFFAGTAPALLTPDVASGGNTPGALKPRPETFAKSRKSRGINYELLLLNGCLTRQP
jgi:hypothetical protein